MNDLFEVINLHKEEKIGNLNVEAHGVVKSTKYFPIYKVNDKDMIFKPLSKTKPFATPLFAYSEVYWSYIIDKYFTKCPRYTLACTNDNLEDKYYNKGVLVEFINKKDEDLINLFDYFNVYKEDDIDINYYINFCMKNYDYDNILNSKFIKNNPKIGEDLSLQILLSILRQDQNYHYENVNFLIKDDNISLAPPIDFEFSSMFLFPDNENKRYGYLNEYANNIKINYENDKVASIIQQLMLEAFNTPFNNPLKRNLCMIIKLYPNVVLKFINNLDNLINDLPDIKLYDNYNFIDKLNSDYYKLGDALYKKNDKETYKKLKEKILLKEINKEELFDDINKYILDYSKFYSLTLKLYILAHFSNINIDSLTIKELNDKININYNSDLDDINNKIKLKIKNNF